MHTHSYKRPNGFENKNVVVVGIGNSGGDAAVELSMVAKQFEETIALIGCDYLRKTGNESRF
ncbi:dimethylaniline monooxygenase [N-oxide-forming] 5-like protein [Leptotrombidium deliense]|uniref:Flavin-containing monooxygenase n=1 Tax=Leptotrombidium deliense TaxID=299467 RepID=A0A443RUE1_9ACAR|nr:dimethylaniline monooxygenase [N-oxide-forming] 5-like protein [Leptotrombidium deliense]